VVVYAYIINISLHANFSPFFDGVIMKLHIYHKKKI